MRPLLIMVAAAALLAGCGSSSSSGDKATTAQGTTAAAATTTSKPAATAPSAVTVDGDGYTVGLPKGWKDASANLRGSAIKFDTAYIDPKVTSPRRNFIVVRETPGGNLTAKQLDQVNTTFRGQAATLADPKGVGPTRTVTLDGEPARTYEYVMRSGGGTGRQRQEFVIHDGAVYTITWTTPSKGYAASDALFDAILSGWRWK